MSLPSHLYSRGLLEGRHSDITVLAFGQRYPLHRLILDRAPFFAQCLSGPWIESREKEVALHPEEIDANITQAAFELAVKRLYGCDISQEEDEEAVGLFATACWLEMQDLAESSIEAILRQLSPETLAPLIRLVTSNYYGRSGDRILASAKSMLCRNGSEMPLKYWDGIPGDVIREIVAGDGFFVDSEWDRWVLAKRLLDRRLRQQAIEAGLAERGQRPTPKAPDSLCLMAVRFDAVYRQNSITTGQPMPGANDKWLALYTHPDIERILVLLDEGIHYIHLEYEQLAFIKGARDILGLPVMPEKVLSNALWQQLELRRRVLDASEADQELGLGTVAQDVATTFTAKGKGRALKQEQNGRALEEEADMESGSWDGNAKPRKFWIPSTDANIVLGNGAEPVVTTSSSFQRHANRVSATVQPEDAQWATDFASSLSTITNPNTRIGHPPRPTSASGSNAGQPKPIAYTAFPPFRFSAEFPNPRFLKEKKRVYSRTVSYAGSLWNIYIQKVRSAKNVQLGVYLHRAKESDAEDGMGSGLTQQMARTVDERIGQLERQFLLRAEGHEHLRTARRRAATTVEEDTSGSGGDADATLVSTGSHSALMARRSGGGEAYPTRFRTLSARLKRHHRSSSPAAYAEAADGQALYKSREDGAYAPVSDKAVSDESDSDLDELEATYPSPSRVPSRKARSLTLPPYVDGRPTIKTYFKIYSPSKGGRMLSVYESAPDRFNFSQSWGWKSSTLMLDEVVLSGGAGGGDGDSDGESDVVKGRDGKLRFMVVIGNL